MSCSQQYTYPSGFSVTTAQQMLPLIGYVYTQYYTAVFGAQSSWPSSAQQNYGPFATLPTGWTMNSQYMADEGGSSPVPIGGWFVNGSQYVLVFRGTAGNTEITDDTEIFQTNINGITGCVHAGFAQVWGELSPALSVPTGVTSFIITGHSLGAALAQLAALQLSSYNPTVYTFGCPATGDPTFASNYDSTIKNNYRVTSAWDIIPNVPPPMVAPIFNSVPFVYQQTGGQCPVYTKLSTYVAAASQGQYLYGHYLTTYQTGLSNLAKAQSATPAVMREVPAAPRAGA